MAYASTAGRADRIASRVEDEPITSTPIVRTLRAGLVAGEVAGLVMAVAMMAVYNFALGKNPFLPLQAIGAMVHGNGALDGMNAKAFFTGLVIHQLGPSLFWGLALSVVVILSRPRYASTLLLLGIAVGVLAQGVDVYLLLPRLEAELGVPSYWTLQVHPVASWFFHIVYGVSLSLFPWKYDPVARHFA